MIDFHRAKVVLVLMLSSLVLVATSDDSGLLSAQSNVTIGPGELVTLTLVANRRAVRHADSSQINVSPVSVDAGFDAGADALPYDLVLMLRGLPTRVSPTTSSRTVYPAWHELCERDDCSLTLTIENGGTNGVDVFVEAQLFGSHEGGFFCGESGVFPDSATLEIE